MEMNAWSRLFVRLQNINQFSSNMTIWRKFETNWHTQTTSGVVPSQNKSHCPSPTSSKLETDNYRIPVMTVNIKSRKNELANSLFFYFHCHGSCSVTLFLIIIFISFTSFLSSRHTRFSFFALSQSWNTVTVFKLLKKKKKKKKKGTVSV